MQGLFGVAGSLFMKEICQGMEQTAAVGGGVHVFWMQALLGLFAGTATDRRAGGLSVGLVRPLVWCRNVGELVNNLA